VLVWGYFEPC